MYQQVKSIEGKSAVRCTEVVRFSEGPLSGFTVQSVQLSELQQLENCLMHCPCRASFRLIVKWWLDKFVVTFLIFHFSIFHFSFPHFYIYFYDIPLPLFAACDFEPLLHLRTRWLTNTCCDSCPLHTGPKVTSHYLSPCSVVYVTDE